MSPPCGRLEFGAVKITAASLAALALFVGGVAAACGSNEVERPTYTVTQSIPGVGTGGLTGTGYGETQP